MREEAIAEIGLDGKRRVFVRPASGDCEHVYRAGMEVNWDQSSRRLSHPRPPRDWTPVDWFQQIVAAVADEYGVRLMLTADTALVEVPNDIQSAMKTAAQAKGS